MNRLFAALLLIGSPLCASEQLDLARTTLQEWVDVEKSISQEMQSWRNEEATTLDLIAIMEKESEALQAQLEELEMNASLSEDSRSELIEEESKVDELRDVVITFLLTMESSVKELKTWLPKPLTDKLQPFYSRIPKDPNTTSLGIAERMQTVIGILSSVHGFDGKISLSREIRELSDGNKGEIQALYLGLASAYYLAPNGADAGYGVPTADGWKWESAPELANKLKEAIAVYEGVEQEARFLALPIAMGGEG
ncbi:DUF3450 domain-containing protein [Puniceicoccaceae bacterium K14]|nr:DUF3450 domain-containing protein [Puniceicoccaceae bacterium K14]